MRRALPERMCVGCRAVRKKEELVRIVRRPDGVTEWDPTGRREGRGAYLCPDAECLEKAVRRKALERALKGPIPAEVVERLRAEIVQQ